MEEFMNDATISLMTNYFKKAKSKKPNSASVLNVIEPPVPKPRAAPIKHVQPLEYEPLSDSDSDQDSYHIKSYPIQALSTFGLKLVPTSIPRRPYRKLRKSEDLKENAHIPVSSQASENIHSPESPRLQPPAKQKPKQSFHQNVSSKVSPSKSRPSNVPNKMLSIVVENVKGVKVQDIMTELHDFLRLRRMFPKLVEALPDPDVEAGKDLQFSAEAVKTVLGFIFSPSYDYNSVKTEVTAVEIISIIRQWEISKFSSFDDFFLKNILNERNANRVFSLAHHFGLEDIKDACLKFAKDPSIKKQKERACTVFVCTYTDPLEMSIPLEPISENLSESFDRDILNDVVFEALSGCYVITGIQVQLNLSRSMVSEKIKILYSAESEDEDLCIAQRTVLKQMGPTIFVNFRKNLTVSAGKKVKISLEMNTKPCICFIANDMVIKGSSFHVKITSNRKAQFSDKFLFLVGKIYYHLKPSKN